MDLNPLVLGLGSHMTKYYLENVYNYVMTEYSNLIADIASLLLSHSKFHYPAEKLHVNRTLIEEV